MNIGTTPTIEEIPLRKHPLGTFRDKDGNLVKLRADQRHMQLYLLRGFTYVGGTDALPSADKITKQQLADLVERTRGVEEDFKCRYCDRTFPDATARGCHERTHKHSIRRSKK